MPTPELRRIHDSTIDEDGETYAEKFINGGWKRLKSTPESQAEGRMPTADTQPHTNNPHPNPPKEIEVNYLSRENNEREGTTLYGRIRIALDRKETFEISFDSLSMPEKDYEFSESRSIMRLGAIESGEAEQPDGRSIYHSRYYCLFISIPGQCLLAQESGLMCDGHWDGDTWVATEQIPLDFDKYRPVVRKTEPGYASGHSEVVAIKNPERCDSTQDQEL
ncbi:hypothetical protein [Zestomonas carbonaria]|uniref:hypothetical protein n=1 Tax=Zestomonas carbonaria TaxID=2762745 RepID=UPI00165714AA|nr:hypothetical protein [Pseudomonas carbonaria]